MLCSQLNGNQLTGEIPKELGRANLNDLRLGVNYLTGSLGALWDKFFDNPWYRDQNQWKARSASLEPQSCLKGAYRQRTDAKTLGKCLECTAGHYCDWSSFSTGLGSPKPCPEGTYQGGEGADDPSQCECFSVLACCRSTCSEWCLSAGLVCPLGHSCPTEGTVQPFPCLPGTFSNTTRATSCIRCPSGKFCPQGSSSPSLCSKGTARVVEGGSSKGD